MAKFTIKKINTIPGASFPEIEIAHINTRKCIYK